MRKDTYPRAPRPPAAPRPGYVYVLDTAHRTAGGAPVCKIGMTTRHPVMRAAELSRGGPVGMRLLGFVAAADARGVERAAHGHFALQRLKLGGGSEYFAVAGGEALKWMREENPRYELEANKLAAVEEYEASGSYLSRQSIRTLPLSGAGVSFVIFLFWHPQIWLVWGGWVVGLIAAMVLARLLAPVARRLEAEMAERRRELEAKHHLPVGSLSAGRRRNMPSAG